MRKTVIIAITAIAVTTGLSAALGETQTSSWSPFYLTYKGLNYVSYYNGAYENADSLPALVGTGANAAALTLDYGIDVKNSAVYADATYTDSLSALAATIAEANGRGLSVMVRPLIDFLDPAKIGSYSVGEWRSYYNPTDAAAFFASYKTMIVNVAKVAQENGAAILCIGVELDQLTGPAYLSYWTDIIASVRAVFSGKLTYSADWDDKISPWQGLHGLTAGTGNLATQVSYWNELDYLGIDTYAPISDAANPVLADLIAGWTLTPSDQTSLAVTGNQSLIRYFEGVATQTGKPLLFTEIGYESASDAARQPSGTSTNIYDPALQANLYQAFFEAWQQSGNNLLVGVYFWNWDPNAMEVGPGNGPNFSPQGEPAQNIVTANFSTRPPIAAAATHDFNGDGYSDILWRNADGDVAMWLMQNFSLLAAPDIENVATSWSIAGIRDFDGDGYADVLWRNTDGDVAIWLMNGTSIIAAPDLENVATSWAIVGTGDFNGDGKGDIIWRNTDGDVAIWLMNGTSITAAPDLGNVATTWSIAGTGDFNGDGYSDILWRNSNGDVAIWLMNGTTILSTADIGNVATSWSIAGTGDFNSDGRADILWRNTNGDVAIWLMNGFTPVSTADLGNVSTTWSIAATGDFNSDGYADILWRSTSGDVAIWLMNGLTTLSTADFDNVPTAWTIQGAGAD